MGRSLRILLLDDEPLIMFDLECAVSEAGCMPLTACCIDEAMDILVSQMIDVAILDVSLGNGITCAPVAKELDSKGVPYILYTGDPQPLGHDLGVLRGELVLKPTPSEAVVGRAMSFAERPVG
ncbi:response regulator [Novosphingobium sp. ZN18A2]|uniref:response regulator n=1 Tax=Novosphingobium sp. ZN18A2 TaxID=3079861 RepID=UPI0030CAA295